MKTENLVRLLTFLLERENCSVLMFYDDVYGAYNREEISEEFWNKYCMRCLEELIRKNKNVLENLKNF